MTGTLVVAELGFWISVVSLIAAGLVTSAAYASAHERVQDLAPLARERVLFAFSAGPWIFALLVLGATFLPSLSAWLGLAVDHCIEHAAEHIHLCFQHAAAVPRSSFVASMAVLGSLFALVSGFLGAWQFRSYRLGIDGLAFLADGRSTPDAPFRRLPSQRPLAFTVGLVNPEIFISDGLTGALSTEDLEAVLAHERAHVRRRDGLRKIVLALLTLPLLPPVRRRLREEQALASEELCDAAAAAEVGEPALVARALLAVTRLQHPDSHHAADSGCRMGASPTSHRVHSLLTPPLNTQGTRWAGGFGAALVVATCFTTATAWHVHHSIETALTVLF